MAETDAAARAAVAAREPAAVLARLREAGAARRDPLRFLYLEALARRREGQPARVRQLLDGRLAAALAAFEARCAAVPASVADTGAAGQRADAPSALGDLVRRLAQHSPDVAGDATVAVDVGAVADVGVNVGANVGANFGADVGANPAAHKAAHAAAHGAASAPERAAAGAIAHALGEPRGELKAIRYFRDTWSALSVDQQVGQAIEQAPENAGPLNSHMLVVRSLALMREISPAYLRHFVSYAETLLSLEQAEPKRAGAGKKPGKSAGKSSVGTGSAGTGSAGKNTAARAAKR